MRVLGATSSRDEGIVADMPDNIEFSEGGISEFSSWTLEYNAEAGNVFNRPCKHAYDINRKKRTWRVPRAASTRTQGGYDATAICVDCILEAVAESPVSHAPETKGE
jgi:hypothetical protein